MPTRFAPPPLIPSISPLDYSVYTGLRVPDPITFVLSPQWLDRPQLYPRQATLLKIIFLRDDLFTEYDRMVIEEWEESFRRTGDNGIVPDIMKRIRILKALGYPYFREVSLVLGRRAGKGYVAALAMAYVLWTYMAKGDPQEHYGVDRDKQLACFIFAGKKEQARENLWSDLASVVTGGPCFDRYISKALGESLSVYAPHDFVRIKKLIQRGVNVERDLATFTIKPKESTLMSGRGPASFMQGYDEMAHVVAAGANRSAEELWTSATPALDQFKKDAFIVTPSSPWQQIGQLYANWEMAQEVDEETGDPEYPAMLMLQLTSWEMYHDWQTAHLLPVFPEGFLGDLGEYADRPHPQLKPLKGAIQEYDDGLRKLEKANPETFKVERRSKWQAVIDAYLDQDRIAKMFQGWQGEELQIKHTGGALSVFYKGHADPSLANANFAVAIAHPETDDDGTLHCIFDYIGYWRPSDFPDNIIDYVAIDEELWELIEGFKPDEFTFDQWNSANSIARLQKKIREAKFPKRVQVYEKTATVKHNWERAETFKIALNQEWIHAPYHELADLELRFLQLKNGKVVKQETGPVQTKDVADCLMECVWTILGSQVHQFTHGALSQLTPSPTVPGGFNPYSRESKEDNVLTRLSGLGNSTTFSRRAGGRSPARNPLAHRSRR